MIIIILFKSIFRIPKVLSNMLTVVEIIALGECLMIGTVNSELQF